MIDLEGYAQEVSVLLLSSAVGGGTIRFMFRKISGGVHFATEKLQAWKSCRRLCNESAGPGRCVEHGAAGT